MGQYGRVVGGHYVNATVTLSAAGELATHIGWRKLPKLTSETVARWERIDADLRSPGHDALLTRIGRWAAAARDLVRGPRHTVRIDWKDGASSLIELPPRLFVHLAVMLRDREVLSGAPSATAQVPIPAVQADPVAQIAQLAALRDQGILTEAEFARTKAELLARL